MNDPAQRRRNRMPIVYGILSIVLILVVMQLWLLTATTGAFLGGNARIVWPAAIASIICLGLNIGLMRYLDLLERP